MAVYFNFAFPLIRHDTIDETIYENMLTTTLCTFGFDL
jgi:hypothetical protein